MDLSFRGNLFQQLVTPPPPGRLLERAHVQDAIMKMVQHLRVGCTCKECLVGMHAVTSEQGSARGWDVLLNVGEELVGGGGGGSGRGAHGGREARAPVRVDAPLIHRVEGGVRDMDDRFKSLGLDEIELRVRDEAADLEDLVGVGVETCHLWESARRVCSSAADLDAPRSQSRPGGLMSVGVAWWKETKSMFWVFAVEAVKKVESANGGQNL